MPKSPFAYVGQVIIYALIAALLGYFSIRPSYTYFPSDQAQLTLSFSHVGKHVTPCRKPTAEETANTAPNMRRRLICPRERLPLLVEIELSNSLVYSEILQPIGIARDGAAQAHSRIAVAPGEHRIVARMRDSDRPEGFDYEAETTVRLEPRENYVINFRSESGGFLFGANRKRADQGER